MMPIQMVTRHLNPKNDDILEIYCLILIHRSSLNKIMLKEQTDAKSSRMQPRKE